MTFSVSIQINDNALLDFINEFPDAMDDAIGSLAFDGQAWVQDQMGSDGSPSPEGGFPGIDEGTLKNSFYVDIVAEMARLIGASAEHALPLEFGTSKMAARPFMMPLAHWYESNAEASLRSYLRL